jgi:general secretion pathway protein H
LALTAKPAVKVKMRTSAAGNSVKLLRGFTLLELLLVLAIVAIASVGITLSMRDSAQGHLESEAQRLVAVLEAGRAQSRASGVPLRWRAETWASNAIVAQSDSALLLGPEPIIAPQSVRMWLTDKPHFILRIATDGVRPFAVVSTAP